MSEWIDYCKSDCQNVLNDCQNTCIWSNCQNIIECQWCGCVEGEVWAKKGGKCTVLVVVWAIMALIIGLLSCCWNCDVSTRGEVN